jgi:hypothetical protein
MHTQRRSAGPDYLTLKDVLLNLCQPLDLAAETILKSDEAAKIRACGIEARKGEWYCPALPRAAVGSFWRLSHLCNDIDPYERPVPWREKRAAIRSVAIDPLGKFDHRLIRLLQDAPGQCLSRGALKRTLWRSGARFVDYTIDRLLAEDHITEHEGWLYPFGKSEFNARIEAQKRPRLLVPVSTGY